MSKTLLIALATGLVSCGLALGMTSPAQAASNCYTTGGLACYYDGSNYGGARGVIQDSDFSGTCYLNIFAFTTASSLANNSVNSQTWYRNSNYSGSTVTVARQSGVATLSSTMNNNVRSWKGTCYGGVLRASASSNDAVPSSQPSAAGN